MYVRDWMTPEPITIGPETSIFEAKRILNENEFRHLPVVEDGRLVGVIAQSDLLGASLLVAQTLADPASYLSEIRRRRVREFMTSHVVTVSPSDTIVTVARAFRDERIGCLPVIEDGRLVGILTETDAFDVLVRALGLREDEEVEIFTLERGDSSESADEIAEWLSSRGLTLVSLLTYEPRGRRGETHVLVKARERKVAFVP